MDKYKFFVVLGSNVNEKEKGDIIYYGDNVSGELHIKSFIDFIKEYFSENELLSSLNIHHQPTIPIYLLTELGHIIFMNTTSLEDKELEKRGRDGILFLPKNISNEQLNTLIDEFHELEDYDIMIKGNLRIEDGMIHSDTKIFNKGLSIEEYTEAIKSFTNISDNKKEI